MEIKLGHTPSPPNKINKIFTPVKTMNGSVVGEFDERNPVVDFRGGVNNINYATINGLWYYITGVSYPVNGIMRVSFDLDLLKSYRTYIMGIGGLVERDSSLNSPVFFDDEMQVSIEKETVTQFIDHIPMDEFSGAYILAVNNTTLRGFD